MGASWRSTRRLIWEVYGALALVMLGACERWAPWWLL